MTTTIANRPQPTVSNTTATSSAPAASGAPPVSAEAMPTAEAAATFSPGASSPRTLPFNPPPSPKLIDESKVAPAGREAIREENRARIESYNNAYAAYATRYTDAVKSAPDAEAARRLGPPADYTPMGNLPVKQQAQYSDLAKSSLDQKVELREALGTLRETERGRALPGVYAFGEVKGGALGQSLEWKGSTAGGGEGEAKLKVGFDTATAKGLNGDVAETSVHGHMEVSSKTGKPELVGGIHHGPVDVELGPDGHHKIAFETGAVAMQLEDGKLSTEGGLGGHVHVLGRKAEAVAHAGSSYDGKTQKVEAYARGAAKIDGVFEAELKLGIGAQLLTAELVGDAIDPNGTDFFDSPANDLARVQVSRGGSR